MELKKNEAEVASNGITFILNFMEISQVIKNVKGGDSMMTSDLKRGRTYLHFKRHLVKKFSLLIKNGTLAEKAFTLSCY
jgi:hypothetical protein